MGTISTYLDANTQKELISIFENAYQGLQVSTTSFLILRKKALREVKGLFSLQEVYALIDIHNATIFEPQIASMNGTLIANIEDADNLEGLGEKWSIDIGQLISKVKTLNDYQVFFLSFECYSFWYGTNAGNNLESFAKKLT